MATNCILSLSSNCCYQCIYPVCRVLSFSMCVCMYVCRLHAFNDGCCLQLDFPTPLSLRSRCWDSAMSSDVLLAQLFRDLLSSSRQLLLLSCSFSCSLLLFDDFSIYSLSLLFLPSFALARIFAIVLDDGLSAYYICSLSQLLL